QTLSFAGNTNRGSQVISINVSERDVKRKDSLTSPVSESQCRGDWIRTSDLLNRNQARSSTECSRPRRRDGLINLGGCSARSGTRVDSKLLTERYLWPKVRA